MRTVTPIPEVYDTDTAGEAVTCMVCDQQISIVDAAAERKDHVTGDFGRVHRACTKEGVERWNRENRPTDSPLAAEREKWTWATTI